MGAVPSLPCKAQSGLAGLDCAASVTLAWNQQGLSLSPIALPCSAKVEEWLTWDEFLYVFLRFCSLSHHELCQALFQFIVIEIDSPRCGFGTEVYPQPSSAVQDALSLDRTEHHIPRSCHNIAAQHRLHYLTWEQLSEYYDFYSGCGVKSFNTKDIEFHKCAASAEQEVYEDQKCCLRCYMCSQGGFLECGDADEATNESILHFGLCRAVAAFPGLVQPHSTLAEGAATRSCIDVVLGGDGRVLHHGKDARGLVRSVEQDASQLMLLAPSSTTVRNIVNGNTNRKNQNPNYYDCFIVAFPSGEPPFRETCDMLAPDALGCQAVNVDQHCPPQQLLNPVSFSESLMSKKPLYIAIFCPRPEVSPVELCDDSYLGVECYLHDSRMSAARNGFSQFWGATDLSCSGFLVLGNLLWSGRGPVEPSMPGLVAVFCVG
eukprot:2279600-Amphidinium_carterae.1